MIEIHEAPQLLAEPIAPDDSPIILQTDHGELWERLRNVTWLARQIEEANRFSRILC